MALARQYDVVLVDSGSTMSDVSLAALEAASLVLWLTTPDYASAHDSVRALQVLSTLPIDDDRIRLVLNQNTADLDVSPASIEAALGRSIFWTIPYDREVRRSAQLGHAVVEAAPRSAAAISFLDLATVLSGGSPAPHRQGLFRKLFSSNGHSATGHRQEAPTS
jgi:pilus assembly protein CpaE